MQYYIFDSCLQYRIPRPGLRSGQYVLPRGGKSFRPLDPGRNRRVLGKLRTGQINLLSVDPVEIVGNLPYPRPHDLAAERVLHDECRDRALSESGILLRPIMGTVRRLARPGPTESGFELSESNVWHLLAMIMRFPPARE